MLTPERIPYTYPARFTTSNEPYQIKWASLLETGETMTSVTYTVTKGDTEVGQETLVSNVSTFWLSGGTTAIGIQELTVTFTSSFGETDVLQINFPVLDPT